MRGEANLGGSQESEKATARLTAALAHELRLQILRLSVESSAPVSPRKAAEELPAGLSNVAYHFRVLAEVDALVLSDTSSVEGVTQELYSPNPVAVKMPAVEELLTASSQASS